MSMPNKSRKGKNDVCQGNTKPIKTDNKQDNLKQTDKAQPTAEQMRIAQIIDTKLEDPTLKDKIRQVMDATQKTEDEVCTALHDCDNDPDRAVNLLLEGVQSEWSTSMKKKKSRTPGEKSKDNPALPYPHTVQEDSDWSAEAENEPVSVQYKAPEFRGKGRGLRAPNRGQDRWRGRENKENEKNTEPDRGRRGRISNGPSRGRGGGGRGGRGFNRGRPPFRKPIETWDSTTTNSNHDVVQLEDWDNEEYTGSLADSKVFTPSSTADPIPQQESEEIIQQDERQSGQSTSPDESRRQSLSAVQFLTQFASNQQTNKTGSLSKNCSVYHEASHFARSDLSSSAFTSGFGVTSYSTNATEPSAPPCEDIRLPRTTTNRIRPRIPPPSKIPSSAVEMPPDAVGSGMALLDVQFGALDFGETTEQPAQQQQPSTPPQRSPSPTTSDKLTSQQTISGTESLLISSDSSFSPVRSTGSGSMTQIPELNTKSGESVPSALYQEPVYPTSQFTKNNHQQSSATFNSTYSNSQATSNTSAYNASTSSAANSYSTSSVGNYSSSSYLPYQGYPNYPSHTTPMPHLQSTNSYQSVGSQYGGTQSVYGSAGLGSTTSSYSAPYPSYSNNSQHNHKSSTLSSVANNNKEFETTSPSVNLNSISQSNTINATPSLLSSTQTTSTTKPTAMSTMSKGAVVPNMPPGVPPIVGAQYIMSQGGLPYFQQPVYSYEELQIMPQQRLPPHLPAYYEVGYQTPNTREGVQYNMSDARYARADNNTSPVQVTSINQQSGTQAHQQPLMNPTAIPPAYAYFFGGSMIPGNFQYGAPTIFPVAATGAGSGHSTSSGVYGKGPATYTGGYGGTYEGGQGTTGDYKSASQVPKTQPTQSNNPPTSSDIPMYSTKSHGGLSKVNEYFRSSMPLSYEKPGFHCPTPPPFTLGSQSSGMGPAGGYPQHLFIPAMTPHHNTTLMPHQPLHQDGTSSVTGRSQVGNQPNKVGTKANYNTSAYWTQN